MTFLKACLILFAYFITFPSAASPENSPWEFTGAGGLAISNGNSDSVAYSLQFLGSYVKDSEEAYFGADYFYSEDGGIESTDSLKLFSQYNHALSERIYVGGYGSFFRDSVADISYQIRPSALVGYRVIKRESMKLAFEAGPGYLWEERAGLKRDYATMRFAEKFEYEFNGTTKFWQSSAITPRLEDFSNYLLDFEIGIETRITDQWSLRTFMKHRIDSTPAVGKGRSDTSILLGVSYDFNGLPEPEKSSERRSLMLGTDKSGNNDKGWVSLAALGYSLNQGNSESMSLNATWETAFHSDENEFFFDLAQAFKENNGTNSEDKTVSRTQYNRFLSKNTFYGTTLGFLRDGQAEIDYRITPGIIAGYYVIKNNSTKLAFEAGPAYTFESAGGIGENFISVVVAERFSHQFNELISFKQATEFNAEAADLGNHSFLISASLDTKLSNRLIWRIGVNHSFESNPAAARKSSDTSATSSIALKF